jgi:putative spermidine/putrescine transport system permease protein
MRQIGQTRTLLILLIPGLLFITLFFLVPLVFVLVQSFQVEEGAGWTLAGYVDFFTRSTTVRIYWRTLRIGLIVTSIAIVLGYPASYLLSRMPPGRRTLLVSLVILPLMTNPVARTYAWLIILGRFGLASKTLMWLGITDEPTRFLYSETAIIIGLVQLFLPLMVLSLVSALENISDDVIEAARSLGANGFTTFLRVIVPLSADGLVLGGTLVFTGAITAYVTPAILGGPRLLVLSTLLQQRALVAMDWTGATVVAVVMLITALTINLVLRRLRPEIA